MLPDTLTTNIFTLFLSLGIIILVLALLYFLFSVFVIWFRWRDREEKSLKLVTLMVAVPQDNEVKIDAMEPIIGIVASFYKSAKFKLFQNFIAQPSLSLEIVGNHDDIRFYISLPEKYRDLLEKQIYSVYAGADIQAVDEPNIFSENGKVETAWLGLKKESYYPLKTYKEIPTDTLSAFTSVLSKLNTDESIAIQLVLSPTDSGWSKSGKSFISNTKKSESNPEKAGGNFYGNCGILDD